MMRDNYIEEIGYENYGIEYFNEDMRIYFNEGLEVDKEDFDRLKENQAGVDVDKRVFDDIEDIDEKYGEVFDKIFNIVDRDGTDNFDIITDDIVNQFDVSGIGYKNAETWLLELYDDTSGARQSFMEYYFEQETEKLEELKGLIQGKTISVTDSYIADGQNTHFIANIDFATTFFKYMNNNASSWRSFDWWEGYRSEKEQRSIYKKGYKYDSPHQGNNAIDFGNVKGANGIISPDLLWSKA